MIRNIRMIVYLKAGDAKFLEKLQGEMQFKRNKRIRTSEVLRRVIRKIQKMKKQRRRFRL